MNIPRLLFILIPLCLAACTNFSTLQTARTIPQGKYRVGIGAHLYKSDVLNETFTKISNTTDSLDFYFAELSARYGFADHLDAGVKVTLIGSILADFKFQFVEAGPIAMATGLGGGYVDVGTDADKLSIIDTFVPLYLSLDFTEDIGIYTAGKYAYRFPATTGSGFPAGSFISGSFGLRLGDKFGIFAEATYIKQLRNPFDAWQFGAGFFFGNGGSWDKQGATARRANRYLERRKEGRRPAATRTRASDTTATVLKVRNADGLALVTQPANDLWVRGERVCLFRRNQKAGCGTVTKSDRTGAVVRYDSPDTRAEPGMSVRPEEGRESMGEAEGPALDRFDLDEDIPY